MGGSYGIRGGEDDIMARKAIEIAKWFIKNEYDNPRNTLEGNMKLQKLLYFAQLIHLYKYRKPLFSDEIYAFEHGSVIETVRQEYKCNHQALVKDAYNSVDDFSDQELETLNITADIFGDADAEELSELNHLQKSWRKRFNDSKIMDNYYVKELGVITVEDMMEDLDNIKQIMEAYEMTCRSRMHYEEINGVKFYYDPNEITMDEEMINILRKFPADEPAYSICRDENMGVIIY